MQATSGRWRPQPGSIQWLSLAKPTLIVTHADTHCSLLARTSKCKWTFDHEKCHQKNDHNVTKYHVALKTIFSVVFGKLLIPMGRCHTLRCPGNFDNYKAIQVTCIHWMVWQDNPLRPSTHSLHIMLVCKYLFCHGRYFYDFSDTWCRPIRRSNDFKLFEKYGVWVQVDTLIIHVEDQDQDRELWLGVRGVYVNSCITYECSLVQTKF